MKVQERESGHKWCGRMLSAAGSKHATLDIDYHLQSASRALFANDHIFPSRSVFHQKPTEIVRCHCDTNRVFWGEAPVLPLCRYGHISHSLSTYDPMRGWSSKRGFLEGSVARNSTHLESARARNGASISHKNMGRKLHFSTLEFCLLHHGYPRRPMGSPDAALANVWKKTGWTSNNALGKQIRTVFPNQALV